MMYHASKRRDTGAGAYHEHIPIQWLLKRKNSLWAAHGKFGTFFYLMEEIIGTGAVPVQHDDQLESVGTVGSRCDGITSPSLVGFFMNGKIEGDELPGFEIK